ncbi:MAG TPA: hypothetical protein DCO77_07115 [Nitrospiraceae bacterium]|nr:hypothetical protein [Nitrospiraceae bacterium]
MVDLKKALVPAAWFFYVIIVFEILFMISPFALYYYSVYGDWLNLLHSSSATAWMTGFFLPHFSRTSSPILNVLPKLSKPLVLVGAALFMVGFVQIYWTKVRRTGAVAGGLYAAIRHPQYLALAIVGLGTLLHWPRFFVLIMFVTMLYLYYFLARWEEERMVEKYGEPYLSYQAQTGMFFPRKLSLLFKRFPVFAGKKRIAVSVVLYIVLVTMAVGLGMVLRNYSLSCLSSLYMNDTAVLSPALLTDTELRTAFHTAKQSKSVRARLNNAAESARFLVYVVPIEWRLPDLPMEVEQKGHRGHRGHHVSTDFDRRLYKVLFTRARTHAPAMTGKDIVKKAYGRDPIILAKVNIETRRIIGVETPPPHVRWGDIPTPLF